MTRPFSVRKSIWLGRALLVLIAALSLLYYVACGDEDFIRIDGHSVPTAVARGPAGLETPFDHIRKELTKLAENILAQLFEHNNWANRQIIRACSALSEDQLDANPQSGQQWSIRVNLAHLVFWQQDYLSLLTQVPGPKGNTAPSFDELEESANSSGEGLLALAQAESGGRPSVQLQTDDGYLVEPWVVMVQAVNHANDHRKQIANLFRALEVDPPGLDGWTFGEATDALIKIQE